MAYKKKKTKTKKNKTNKQKKQQPTFKKRIEDKTNSYINERNSATLDIEIEQKSKNLGNITSMGYYPRNG